MVPTQVDPALKKRARAVLRLLKRRYPDARISLDFATPFQLYVATVLSAQCTDVRVNQVTPALFARYPDADTMAAAAREEIEEFIRPTGFFRNKAKSIQEGAQMIASVFGGDVPGSLEALIKIPGVGRKTANVILGNSFDIPGITVDTHVRRLSQRLGFTREQDPVKIEFELMALIPKKDWTSFSHQMILHGRTTCRARTPRCAECDLRKLCPEGLVRTG